MRHEIDGPEERDPLVVNPEFGVNALRPSTVRKIVESAVILSIVGAQPTSSFKITQLETSFTPKEKRAGQVCTTMVFEYHFHGHLDGGPGGGGGGFDKELCFPDLP